MRASTPLLGNFIPRRGRMRASTLLLGNFIPWRGRMRASTPLLGNFIPRRGRMRASTPLLGNPTRLLGGADRIILPHPQKSDGPPPPLGGCQRGAGGV
ncbi:MAG: hypothetical protein AB1846_20005 [Chloroflexota bacterium]